MRIRWPRATGSRFTLAGLLGILLLSPVGASAGPGALTQATGPEGCLTEGGTGGLCAEADLLFGPFSVAVTKDGKNAYVALIESNAVAALSRNRATGALSQLAEPDGCVSETGNGGLCADGKGLRNPVSVAVTPDGKHVYVASFQTDPVAVSAVAAFARDRSTGALTQLAGLAGCLSEDGTGGTCTDATAVRGASAIAVSKDGKHVYVASRISRAVAAFARSKATGVLTQLSGLQGCIGEDGSGGLCTEGRGLGDVVALATSPDGKHVYVASKSQSTIAVLTRNRTTGALSQASGPAGCVVEGGSVGPCDVGYGIVGPVSLVVSPDGQQVYVASEISDAVATFSRDDATGSLTQAIPPEGCISEDGSSGSCVEGDALDNPFSVAIARDGKHVYVASRESDAVAAFARNRGTGALTQLASPQGCISEDGTTGTCTDGRALSSPRSVAVGPDGRQVYVASQGSGVAVLRRER